MASSSTLPISVVILARNEAGNLTSLLPSLDFAGEIIVIDDYSTDQSYKIYAQYRARVIKTLVRRNFGEARNLGLAQAKYDWILFLDTDERLPGNASQVLSKLIKKVGATAYSFKREDYFLGKKLKHGDTGEYWLTRLARKEAGVWEGKVHEEWRATSVKSDLLIIKHLPHKNVPELFRSITQYGTLRGQELYDSKRGFDVFEWIFFPWLKFFNLYLYKLGILDGWGGFWMALAMAIHSAIARWVWLILIIKKCTLTDKLLLICSLASLLLVPLGQLVRFDRFGITGYVFELMMGVVVLAMIIAKKFSKPNVPIPVFLFGSYFVFSSMLGSVRFGSITGLLHLIRLLILGWFLLSLWEMKKSNHRWIDSLSILRVWGVLFTLFGLVQYVLFPDMRGLFWFGFDDHYYRMVGTLFDPNYLGVMLVLTFLLWLLSNGIWRKIAFIPLFSIICTYSRSALVSLVGTLLMLGMLQFKRINWKWVGVIIAAVAVWLVVLPRPGGLGVDWLRKVTIETRLESYQKAIKVIAEYPVFGVGYNFYREKVNAQAVFDQPIRVSAPDNSLLQITATSGFIGLGLFIYLLAWSVKMVPSPLFRLSLLAILIHSMFNNTLFYPFAILWLGMVLLNYLSEKWSTK